LERNLTDNKEKEDEQKLVLEELTLKLENERSNLA
jgi:hypothetical protein